MRMSGVSLEVFTKAVDKVSATYGGNLKVHQDAHQVGVRKFTTIGRVTCYSGRAAGARTSWNGAHYPTTCWHAYRDVLREVFAQVPNAVITTTLARYVGAEGFESAYPATGYQNVGSRIAPVTMPELCECGE